MIVRLDIGKCPPAFEAAWKEYEIGRYAPIRAYYGLIEGLQWGPCALCDEIGFVQKSGLNGMTCGRCEMELHAMLAGPDDDKIRDFASRVMEKSERGYSEQELAVKEHISSVLNGGL